MKKKSSQPVFSRFILIGLLSFSAVIISCQDGKNDKPSPETDTSGKNKTSTDTSGQDKIGFQKGSRGKIPVKGKYYTFIDNCYTLSWANMNTMTDDWSDVSEVWFIPNENDNTVRAALKDENGHEIEGTSRNMTSADCYLPSGLLRGDTKFYIAEAGLIDGTRLRDFEFIKLDPTSFRDHETWENYLSFNVYTTISTQPPTARGEAKPSPPAPLVKQ